MKTSIKILLFFLILFLFACNSNSNKQENNQKITPIKDSIITNAQTTDENKLIDNPDCVRGQAEPVILKEYYPNTTFILQPDSLSAFETVTFKNGDKLIIHNWGCEYYVLTFRFETTKFKQDTTNLEYWFKSAIRLMTEMLAGINAPIDIKRGLVFLESYILKDKKNKFKNLKLGDKIYFDGDEIKSFVRVDKIEKLTKEKFAIDISFGIGPL